MRSHAPSYLPRCNQTRTSWPVTCPDAKPVPVLTASPPAPRACTSFPPLHVSRHRSAASRRRSLCLSPPALPNRPVPGSTHFPLSAINPPAPHHTCPQLPRSHCSQSPRPALRPPRCPCTTPHTAPPHSCMALLLRCASCRTTADRKSGSSMSLSGTLLSTAAS